MIGPPLSREVVFELLTGAEYLNIVFGLTS